MNPFAHAGARCALSVNVNKVALLRNTRHLGIPSVLRAAEIELAFQDRHGAAQQVTATGLVAICMQHELDHLDGITFLDRLSPLKRRVVLRDYLRDNAERIAEQDRKAKLQQRRARA